MFNKVLFWIFVLFIKNGSTGRNSPPLQKTTYHKTINGAYEQRNTKRIIEHNGTTTAPAHFNQENFIIQKIVFEVK